IGAASAVALAEAGADVVIAARTSEQLEETAKRVAAVDRRAIVVVADLSDLEATAALAARAKEELGRLDVVVNNVGGAMPRPFLDTSPGRLEQAFAFNVATAHALTRAAVPVMLEDGGGSVVNISSAIGRVRGRGYLAYGTAKGALSHYTRLAAADLAPRIRVNAIAVGSVATSALEIVMQSDELREAIEAATPLGRLGQPEDIAAAVVYLSSPAGSFLTGKVLEVDGGIEEANMDLGLPDL
ncbi:MAG TPA: SDR family oxidoreductase, partial [Acidimicrobiales bacterium]|nr:SDR family oxidoreductase [Acidimicrobiales bacterium]